MVRKSFREEEEEEEEEGTAKRRGRGREEQVLRLGWSREAE